MARKDTISGKADIENCKLQNENFKLNPGSLFEQYCYRAICNLQFSFCNFQFAMQFLTSKGDIRAPPRHVLQFESESHHLRGEQRFCHLQICRCWPI